MSGIYLSGGELFIPVPTHGRLIDADYLDRHLLKMQKAQTGPCSHGVRKARAVLRDAPTVIPADNEDTSIPSADVRPVVLCKDCKYWEPVTKADENGPGRGDCIRHQTTGWKETFFCADGSRKDAHFHEPEKEN